MEYKRKEREIIGPYKLSCGNNIFHDEISKLYGIYLFTVQYNEGYLIYYVGETGQSFFNRLKDHVIQYFGGNYRIFNPDKFAKAEKEIIWNGMWRKGTRDLVPTFIENSKDIVPIIKRFVQLFDIFLIPFESETQIRRRIESALAFHLKKQKSPIGNFQDEDIRYIKKQENEEPIIVKFFCLNKIYGISNEFLA